MNKIIYYIFVIYIYLFITFSVYAQFVSSVEISTPNNTYAIAIANTLQFSANVLPANALDKTLTWSVDNVALASIDNTGLLTPITAGTVMVKATSNDGSNIVATKKVVIENTITRTTNITITQNNNLNTITTKGTTLQLMVTILPINTTYKEVNWTIDNPKIATVSTNGLLTPITDGTVTVTATTQDGSNLTDNYSITISNQNIIYVNTLKIEPVGNQYIINQNNATIQFNTTILPANATNTTLDWSVSNTELATISNSGLLTAKGNGKVYVYCKTTDGSNINKSTLISIGNQIVKITGLTIDGEGGINTISKDDDTLQMVANILPATANEKTLNWTIINETGIAEITSKGQLIPISDGTVTVTALTQDGSNISASKQITLTNQIPTISSFTIASSTNTFVIVEQDMELQLLIKNLQPATADIKNIVWSVNSITGSAEISQDGLLKPLTNGFVQVTAQANDKGKFSVSKNISILYQSGLVRSITVQGLDGAFSITEADKPLQMLAIIKPDLANDKSVSWRVIDDTGSAAINSRGVLSPLTNGNVKVVAITNDGSNLSDTAIITIVNQTELVKSISVNGIGGKNIINRDLDTLQMLAVVYPKKAKISKVEWSVDTVGVINPGSAIIDKETGALYAFKNGNVQVFAKSTDGSNVIGSTMVNIINQTGLIRKITLTTTGGSLFIFEDNGKLEINANIYPKTAVNKTLIWEIDEGKELATINDTGLLVAKYNGNVVVSANSTDDSGVYGTISIKIYNQILSTSVENDDFEVFPNPVENDIYITNKSQQPIIEVVVIDISGKSHILEKSKIENQTHHYNISQFQKGIYIINIKTLQKMYSKKIIKK